MAFERRNYIAICGWSDSQINRDPNMESLGRAYRWTCSVTLGSSWFLCCQIMGCGSSWLLCWQLMGCGSPCFCSWGRAGSIHACCCTYSYFMHLWLVSVIMLLYPVVTSAGIFTSATVFLMECAVNAQQISWDRRGLIPTTVAGSIALVKSRNSNVKWQGINKKEQNTVLYVALSEAEQCVWIWKAAKRWMLHPRYLVCWS